MRHALCNTVRLDHDQIGKLVHESVRQACMMFYDAPLPPWADASDAQRRAATTLVGQLAADQDLTARRIHDAWVAARRAEGWTHGPDRDTVGMRSPLVAEWGELSPKYRAKQALAVVLARHLLRPEAESA